jgi:hypothetical protein
MRKFALCLILLSPFLVCDPYQGADYFVITGLPPVIDASHIPPDASGKFAFMLDLANLPVGGPYSVKAQACSNEWGCSEDSDPFVFSRPVLSVPMSIKLSR